MRKRKKRRAREVGHTVGMTEGRGGEEKKRVK